MQVSEVKENLLKKVRFRGSEYQLIGYVLWVDRKERRTKHSVKLLDTKSQNSEILADIDEVEVIANE